MKFPSIFSSIVRAFFGSFFGVLGVFLALIVIVFVIAGMSFGDQSVEVSGRFRVLPNADGTKTELSASGPLILSVNIKGVIGSESLNTETITEQLNRSQESGFRDRIKGVLLLINSPGGSVFDSNSIYRLVQAYKKQYEVPVYVYADGLLASGGYYIACAADKIYASEISIIGSVGVLFNTLNFSGALDKIGVKSLVLTQGKGKGALNPLRPWKEGEEKNIENIIAYFYQQFIGVVISNRPEISKKELIDTYGAQVFPAPEAASYGYIDEVVESHNVVLEKLVEEAEIESYQVVQLEDKPWFDRLFTGKFMSFAPKGYLYLYENPVSH